MKRSLGGSPPTQLTNQCPSSTIMILKDGDKGFIPYNLKDYLERIKEKKEAKRILIESTHLLHENIRTIWKTRCTFLHDYTKETIPTRIPIENMS
jgi:hypothetical protein